MPTDLGLGLSLVDNPVAVGGGEAEKNRRKSSSCCGSCGGCGCSASAGELLSTVEGKPTALCKGALAGLVGYPRAGCGTCS